MVRYPMKVPESSRPEEISRLVGEFKNVPTVLDSLAGVFDLEDSAVRRVC